MERRGMRGERVEGRESGGEGGVLGRGGEKGGLRAGRLGRGG